MPLSESRKKANAAWDSKNLKRLSLAMNIELYDKMKAVTDASGDTVNGFINTAIREKIERQEIPT